MGSGRCFCLRTDWVVKKSVFKIVEYYKGENLIRQCENVSQNHKKKFHLQWQVCLKQQPCSCFSWAMNEEQAVFALLRDRLCHHSPPLRGKSRWFRLAHFSCIFLSFFCLCLVTIVSQSATIYFFPNLNPDTESKGRREAEREQKGEAWIGAASYLRTVLCVC